VYYNIVMVIILHNVRSLHNVGSIFRTADAAGVEKIYLCGITSAPVDSFGRPRQQLTKVSLGAEKYVKWDASAHSVQAITKLLKRLKKDGYKIFAIEQNKKSIPYYKVKNSSTFPRESRQKIALILGSEMNGLPPSILKRADKILEIPMFGKKESLNVAVAFGIVVFKIRELYND